ncbi:MAG: tRNA (N(6)-L-threonylcarbamoyladenosine(37)-C(2))-methylthiotransferase MtaB [Syntrophomonadaceae bacterium]|jgi:threonylcarbamoyladenosine tRNA methylthiotransferase MtaB
MKKAAFYTLGCKVNQVETEELKEALLKQGFAVVDFDDIADIYIINTCTVTHVSDKKSRAVIRRAVRRNPRAFVVVTGCLAQTNPEQIEAISGVSLVVDNRSKEKIPLMVAELTGQPIPESTAEGLHPVLYGSRHERTRAFIKIQDGCHSYCTYCIVPHTRGGVRSKKAEHVQLEMQHLLELGYREIVLTGIHTGLYGYDLENTDLTALLKQLLQLDGDYRLRLSSIEPLEISPALLEVVQHEKKVCKYLHIPLQSGSDSILKAMNRRYNREFYYDLLYNIARQIPGIGLSADVMVGFPGESAADFRATYDLLAELPLHNLHVFKYSRREGTPAAGMAGQIEEAVKQERSQTLLKLARRKRNEAIDNIRGQVLRVLVEKRMGDSTYTGLSDNYIELSWDSRQDLRGEFALIRIVGRQQGLALGCTV